jgi:hypothetical protein
MANADQGGQSMGLDFTSTPNLLVSFAGAGLVIDDHSQGAPDQFAPQDMSSIETWGLFLQSQDRNTHPAERWSQPVGQPYGRTVELAPSSDFQNYDPLAAELSKL